MGDRGGELRSPGPGRGEAQPQAAASAGEPAGGGEQARRRRLGSQPRAAPSRASICIQASSSLAMATSSHQSWFWSSRAAAGYAARCPWRSGSGPRIWRGGGGAVPGQRAARGGLRWRRQ
jgi:hypothetical protein